MENLRIGIVLGRWLVRELKGILDEFYKVVNR